MNESLIYLQKYSDYILFNIITVLSFHDLVPVFRKSVMHLCIWHLEVCASWYILIIKTKKRCTVSQIYFGIALYMFRTGLLSIIRSLILNTQR